MNMGSALSIGGIFVPEPLVSKVLALLGVIGTVAVSNYVEKGIIFDVDYRGLTSPSPSVGAIKNPRFQ